MRKLLCAVMAFLLVGSAALAGTPKLSADLFSCAKQALYCLSVEDYDALAAMPFSKDAPDAQLWQSLALKYADLSSVQTEYAVGFWTGKIWVIAVPVQPPDDGSVEVLAFSSADGVSFDGCRYAIWSQIEGAYCDSTQVIWDQEYIGSNATVLADLGGPQ